MFTLVNLNFFKTKNCNINFKVWKNQINTVSLEKHLKPHHILVNLLSHENTDIDENMSLVFHRATLLV